MRMEIITKRYSQIKVRQRLIFRFFKDANINFSFCYCYNHRENLLAMSNHSCLIVERKHVFNLRSVENDLSPDALAAGFTNMSLHTEITFLMIFPSEEGNSLTLTTMSSKHKTSSAAISSWTFNILTLT